MRMLDLFSGIGGFHKGFEQAGYEFDWVGFSEIDKYASAVYRHRFPEAVELGDITAIQPGDLPKIDLITFGSPCQDFSIAGKRAGAKEGTRSSLVWQAIRLIAECKPRFFVWENVKGTFSSNSGADFWAIIQAFTNIGGYRLEWQLINTRWFLPQNRERIYLVGYIGDRSGQSVFPIGEDGGNDVESQTTQSRRRQRIRSKDYSTALRAKETRSGCDTLIDEELKQIGTIGKDSMGSRVYADDGISCALRANGSGMGAKTGLYQVDTLERQQDSYDFNSTVYSDKGIAKTLAGDGGNNDNKTGLYKIPEATKKGYAAPIITPNRAENGRRFKEDGETLTGQDQHRVMVKQYGQKSLNETLEKENLKEDDVKALDLYNKKAQDISPTLTEPHHNSLRLYERSQIRRLTPVECCRLQGFPDDWNEFGEFDGEVVSMSDTQRYKQAGNAVTVNVVQAVAERLKINKG